MDKKIELIEKYLMGEMSIKEQIEFEESMRKDAELMKEFLFRKDINEAIGEEDVIDLRNKLEDIGDSIDFTKKKNFPIYTYSSVAAVLILLIVLASKYFNPFNKMEHKEIYETYYQIYPSINENRSLNDSELDQNIFYAFNYYEENKYDRAAEYFKKVFEEDQTNILCQFYLAVSLIEVGEIDEAEEYLVDLTLKQSHLFWEQSHWYLALIYIKKGKIDTAKSFLNKIVNENMANKSEAKLILRSIK